MKITLEIADGDLQHQLTPLLRGLLLQNLGSDTARPPRGFLTIKEAAEWLGVSRTQMYELVASGEIRSVRVGRENSRAIRIAADAIWDWVESQEAESQYRSGRAARPVARRARPKRPTAKMRAANRQDLVSVSEFMELVKKPSEAVEALFRSGKFPTTEAPDGQLAARRGELLDWIKRDPEGWAALA
jgi:excisionase family DNA binding protein